MSLQKLFSEVIIGKFKQDMQIIVSLDKTKHADERRYRHGVDSIITDDDIVKTGKKGISKITKYLLFDKLNIGDEIVLYDPTNNLNLICVIDNPSPNVVELKIITVMQKQDFKPKSGTVKIQI